MNSLSSLVPERKDPFNSREDLGWNFCRAEMQKNIREHEGEWIRRDEVIAAIEKEFRSEDWEDNFGDPDRRREVIGFNTALRHIQNKLSSLHPNTKE